MDYVTLGQHFLKALPAGGNVTSDFTDLPTKILEAVVPGYGLFTSTVQQYLGFDISYFMTCVAFFFIAKRAISFVWIRCYATFLVYCTSSVHIDGTDDLYDTVIQWMAATRPDLSRRSLTARTQYSSMPFDSDNEDDREDADVVARVALDDHGYFNFNKWAARVPPRYEPDFGRFWFSCHRGIFQFSKKETVRQGGSEWGERVEYSVDLCCVGLNTNPIKNLLADIKAWAVRKQSSKTVIRVPTTDRWTAWMRISERPSRPLDTVILDPEQKARIMWDMNEYLHPLSPKWYAVRGIPYRRGYLFHGPPGTGKTSLSFALAGIFGLDIHIINLMDSMMNEGFLNRLFNSLPKRCIVLFEDIDAAGIEKRDSDGEDSDEEEKPVKKAKKSKAKKAKAQQSGRKKTKVNHKAKDQTVANGAGKSDLVTEALDGEARNNDHTVAGSSSVSGRDTPMESNVEASIKFDGKEKASSDLNGEMGSTAESPQNPLSTSDSEKSSDSSSESESEGEKVVHEGEHVRIVVTGDQHSRNASPPPRRRRRYRHKQFDDSDTPEGKISLSGLLNAIDGVATHEGRILIMTTNHPEKLDPALVRAGRVDMQIAFTFATKLQMRQLFRRMYSAAELPGLAGKDPAVGSEEEKAVFGEELDELALKFADELPEQKFAPSDVQGYLLMHRKRPREALAKVGEWRDKKFQEMAEKEKEKGKAKKPKNKKD